MKSVGIDIGSYSIKIAEVEILSRGYALTKYSEHILSTSPAQDQEIEIIDYLRKVSKTYDHAQCRFVIAINQDRISVRHKFFPFKERQKILKSLAFELEDDVPFATDTAVYDAKVIRHSGNQAEVLACACPKVYVAQAYSQAADGGMPPDVITGEGLAFANLFERWEEPPPQVIAPNITGDETTSRLREVTVLLHLGHTRSTVSFYDGTSLISVRSLLWGGKMVSDAIAQKYELPFEAAQREMQNKGFILTMREGATYDQAAFSDTIQASIHDLVKEVQHTFLEAKSELNCQIKSISLTGGTSQIRNLGAYLTQQFEIPVNKMSVLSKFNRARFEVTPAIDAVAGLAVCLAVEGLRRPRNPAINFLKGEFAQQSQYAKRLWERWGQTVIFASAFLVVFMIYGYTREMLAKSSADAAHGLMTEQARTLAGLPRSQMTIPGVTQWIRNQENKVEELKRLEGLADMNSAMEIMNSINSAIPPKNQLTLEVKTLTINGDQVTMDGWVKGGAQGLKTLAQSLGKVARGGKVNSNRSRVSAPPGTQSFSYKFAVDRNVNVKEL